VAEANRRCRPSKPADGRKKRFGKGFSATKGERPVTIDSLDLAADGNPRLWPMDEKAAAKTAGEVRRATEFEDLTTVKAIMITTAGPTENLLRARIQTLLRRRDRDIGMLRPSSSEGMNNFVFYSRYQEQRYSF
jgi:hypothetical protein